MRVCVLASGSSGNCTLVSSLGTTLLIDAGLSGRETVRRLESVGIALSSVSAVCLTHEHDDHCTALSVLSRKAGIPLYANSGTVEAVEKGDKAKGLKWNIFSTGSPFTIGGLTLEPFSVPHDAYDPVGFVVRDGTVRLGIATDIGMSTSLIRERLRGCHVLVIESNHDEELLRDADRPWVLKQRILGRQGHLSNKQAGELVAQVAGSDLRSVFLAHLSAQCNRGDLAVRTVSGILAAAGHGAVAVKLAYPDRVSEVVECEAGMHTPPGVSVP